METNENIIDFGSISVPKSWGELNLKTFQEIERYYTEQDEEKEFNIIDVLHILIGKDKDYIMSLPSEFMEKIVSQLSWLGEEPKHGEPTNKMKINGEEYIVNFQSKLTFGEYTATEMVRKDNPHNYAAILAILCRKEGEKYDSTFENEVLPSRIEMWEKQPMMKVMPILFFFINLFVTLQMSTQLSSEVEEGLNHIRQSIDNSPKIGVFKKYYLKWRMKTLLKSLKSINYT
jgi:hypothetical protein